MYKRSNESPRAIHHMPDNHPVWSRFKDHVDPMLNTLVMKSPGGGTVGPHLQVIMPTSLYTDPNVTDEDRKQVAMDAASRAKPVDMEHVMPYLMGKHASEDARLAVLAHYGLVKRADWRVNALDHYGRFLHGANPQQFARRTGAVNGGVLGGVAGTVIGGIRGAYNAEPGSRLSGAARGAGKGLLVGTALGTGAGATAGHFAHNRIPDDFSRAREAFGEAVMGGDYGVFKRANAGRPVAKFLLGANPQQFARRASATGLGVLGGVSGTLIGGIRGAYDAEPGSRLSGAARGAGKGLLVGTALGIGAGAARGHIDYLKNPENVSREREFFSSLNSLGE